MAVSAHYVKCLYCGKTFNRDKEPTIKVNGRRYAHKECSEQHERENPIPQKSQEEIDLEALENYIMKLFNETYVNARIRKQLKEYKDKYNYTYSGILKTLIYWYEVKGNSIEKANKGIGIVPYIYEDASKYYYTLYVAKLANENKDIKIYKPKEKVIKISLPKVKTKKIKLLFEDED